MRSRTLTSPSRYVHLAVWFCASACILARSQEIVPPQNLPLFNRVFEVARGRRTLPCGVYIDKNPVPDFLFRQWTLVVIRCPLGLIQPDRPLIALIRVTPNGRESTMLIKKFGLSTKAAEAAKNFEAGTTGANQILSGGFATGPGRYSVEVVLTDQENHYARKVARIKVGLPRKLQIRSPLVSGAVAPLVEARWDGELVSNGYRVTVLLNADERGGASLPAHNRVTLMEGVAGLLTQLPCRSVKLVAFNLDQQTEIFRQEHLSSKGFVRLERSLEQLQLATIPYEALQKGAWQDFLVKLLQEEASRSDKPDFVFFIGPSTYGEKPLEKTRETLEELQAAHLRVFYFRFLNLTRTVVSYEVNSKSHEDYPRSNIGFGEIPDRIQDFVKVCAGKTFGIDSRESLSAAIAKLESEIYSVPNEGSPAEATPER